MVIRNRKKRVKEYKETKMTTIFSFLIAMTTITTAIGSIYFAEVDKQRVLHPTIEVTVR